MNSRGIYRKLVIGGSVLTLVLAASWASASNMGFKLNLGVINALNILLRGSGVSFDADYCDRTTTNLVVDLDLAHQDLSPRNSNMGFKLNVTSVPPADGGIEVEDPDGTLYLLKWDDTSVGGGGLTLELAP